MNIGAVLRIASGRSGPKVLVIPYVVGEDGVVKYVWVTSTADPKTWTAPRGTIEQDESPQETAIVEAFEEAGVKGKRRDLTPLGHHFGENPVVVFGMRGRKLLTEFKERHERRRKALTFEKSLALLQASSKTSWQIPFLRKLDRFVRGELKFSAFPLAPPKK